MTRITPTTMPSYREIFDFPAPCCSVCGEVMVKHQGGWACLLHTLVTVGLTPNLVTGEVEPVRWPFGFVYPNRAARRMHL